MQNSIRLQHKTYFTVIWCLVRIYPLKAKNYILKEKLQQQKKVRCSQTSFNKYNSDQICNGLCYLLKQTQFWVSFNSLKLFSENIRRKSVYFPSKFIYCDVGQQLQTFLCKYNCHCILLATLKHLSSLMYKTKLFPPLL